jgi:hypothetical protein
VILPLLCGVIYPIGTIPTDGRISSYAIGGQMRVMWAGGASQVRNEALDFIDTTTHSNPPSSEWPVSIRALGAVFVKVDKNSRTVNVCLPRVDVFANQFGFLIRDAGASIPDINRYVGKIDGYRLWKLADGIYLYEIW